MTFIDSFLLCKSLNIEALEQLHHNGCEVSNLIIRVDRRNTYAQRFSEHANGEHCVLAIEQDKIQK